MTFDYTLAALVTFGLMIYLTYALLGQNGSESAGAMTFVGWMQILLYLRDCCCACACRSAAT